MKARMAALLLVAAAALGGCAAPTPAAAPPSVAGMVWQPDQDTVAPSGRWDALGARTLLVQWTVVDGIAFTPVVGATPARALPDWAGIARQPWARDVIVGLAGRFDERAARQSMPELAAISRRIAASPPPVRIAGWYFPVEVDPTWQDAPAMADALRELPRPLWISVHDTANLGPEVLAQGLQRWLPADVGVFLQDGVGLHAREPAVAVEYLEVLARRLGRERVRLIAEAMRPAPGGGFRPATAAELRPQLAAYRGWPVYLFETRYVAGPLVDALLERRP
jgi:hypothetical protein